MAIFEYLMVSTNRDDATQRGAGQSRSLSNGRWLKRASWGGAKARQVLPDPAALACRFAVVYILPQQC